MDYLEKEFIVRFYKREDLLDQLELKLEVYQEYSLIAIPIKHSNTEKYQKYLDLISEIRERTDLRKEIRRMKYYSSYPLFLVYIDNKDIIRYSVLIETTKFENSDDIKAKFGDIRKEYIPIRFAKKEDLNLIKNSRNLKFSSYAPRISYEDEENAFELRAKTFLDDLKKDAPLQGYYLSEFNMIICKFEYITSGRKEPEQHIFHICINTRDWSTIILRQEIW